MMPIEPVKNIIKAFGPSFESSFKSTLMVRSTRQAGSKYLEATKYNLDSSGSMIPKVEVPGKHEGYFYQLLKVLLPFRTVISDKIYVVLSLLQARVHRKVFDSEVS